MRLLNLVLACRYASFYITRNCLNFVNPVMLQDPSLGLNLTIIGGITSLLPVAYAFSKGISGFLGSTMSPRLLLSCGLASTGLACLAFGFGSNPTWFAFFWAMNGLLQVRFLLSFACMISYYSRARASSPPPCEVECVHEYTPKIRCTHSTACTISRWVRMHVQDLLGCVQNSE